MDLPLGDLKRPARDGAALGGPGLILAGDVGGTKTHLALYAPGPPLRLVRLETFHSPAFSSLEAIIDQFRGGDAVPVTAAALGVAIRQLCSTRSARWNRAVSPIITSWRSRSYPVAGGVGPNCA